MPFKQITLGKTTTTKFLTAEKVILKKTNTQILKSITELLKKEEEKTETMFLKLLIQVEIKVIFKRKLQSLTWCTPPAADPDRGERISLTV